jgi:hypothetical protein
MAAMIFKVPPHWEQVFHIDVKHPFFEQPGPVHTGRRRGRGRVTVVR